MKYDSTSSLSLCHSNIYISGLSGSICVDVSNSLFSHSWISALYLYTAPLPYVCVWVLKGCPLWTTWTCSCMAAIFRAAQKTLERNARPTCGPAKIILQQKDVWNYKYFPLRRTGSAGERVPRDLVSEGLQWRKTMQQLTHVSLLSAMKVTAGDWAGSSVLSSHEQGLSWCSVLEEIPQETEGASIKETFFQNLKIKGINDICMINVLRCVL